MAPQATVFSAQSKALINSSQNFQSSPGGLHRVQHSRESDGSSATRSSEAATEVVEDSLKQLYDRGAVQPSQLPAESRGDDFQPPSPRTAILVSQMQERIDHGTPADHRATASISNQEKQRTMDAIGEKADRRESAVAGRVEIGAKHSEMNGVRRKGSSTSRKRANSADELQASNDGLTAPVGSTLKKSRKSAMLSQRQSQLKEKKSAVDVNQPPAPDQSAQGNTNSDHQPGTTCSTEAAINASIASLQGRKSGDASAVHNSTGKLAKPGTRSRKAGPMLPPDSAPAQTRPVGQPARSTQRHNRPPPSQPAKRTAAPKASTKFAKTLEEQTQNVGKRKRKQPNDEKVGGESNKKTSKTKPSLPNGISSRAKNDASSKAQKHEQPSQAVERSKPPPINTAESATASATLLDGRYAAVLPTKTKATVDAGTQSPRRKPYVPSTSEKIKPAQQHPDIQGQRLGDEHNDISIVPATNARKCQGMNTSVVGNDDTEAFQQFEDAVVHYPTFSETTEVEAMDRNSTHSKALRAPEAKMRHERLQDHDGTQSASNEAVVYPGGRRAAGPHTMTGTTQEEPISISDRVSPSSAVAGIDDADETVATVPLSHVRDYLQPETPPAMGSSPPVIRTRATSEGTSYPTGHDTSRKPIIIGFDKKGPQNQGILFTGKITPGSALTGKTAMSGQTSGGFNVASASRRRELSGSLNFPAIHKAVAEIEQSTEMSNVAETVGDALSQLLKKPIAQANVPTTKASRQLESQQRDHPHISDGSTGVQEDQDMYMSVMSDEDQPDSDIEPPAPGMPDAALTLIEQSVIPEFKPQIQPQPTLHSVPVVTQTTKRGIWSTDEPSANVTNFFSTFKTSPTRKRVKPTIAFEQAHRTRKQTAYPPHVSPQNNGLHAQPALPSPSLGVAPSLCMGGQAEVTCTRMNRNSSLGLQRVDECGSPIPHNMVVPQQSTVLDTFSKQFDHIHKTCDEMVGWERQLTSLTPPNVPTMSHTLAAPFRQTRQASNSKARPAAPQCESTAISGHVKIETVGERFMFDESMNAHPSNPFVASTADKGRSSSSTYLFPKLQSVGPCKESKRALCQSPPDASKEYDPDKTLVEPEPPTAQLQRKVTSFTSSSPSALSTHIAESREESNDLAQWRDALKPHQLNLFDELVAISHKLVRHLVDAETASRDLVSDFTKRSEHIVQHMEAKQVGDYREYRTALQKQSSGLSKGLAKWSGVLHECVESAERIHAGSAPSPDKLGSNEDMVQRLLAEYC